MLSAEPSLFDASAEILCKHYGPFDHQSDVLPWNATNYYRDEMGEGLLRKFFFFRELLNPEELAKIKLFTNALEQKFASRGENTFRRTINLDPGYLTEAKVVLATTKDYSHRIYIGSGIYAEVTLKYSIRDMQFVPCEYTYVDYQTNEYRVLFGTARELLRSALRSSTGRKRRNEL